MKYALLALLLAVFAVAGAGRAVAARNLSDLVVGKFVDEKTSASLRKDYGNEMEISIEFSADGKARFNGLDSSVEGTYSIDENGAITVDFFEHWAEGELQDAYQEKYRYDASKDSVLRTEIGQLFTRARTSSGRTFHWTAQDRNGYSKPEPDDPSYKPARPSIAGEIIGDGVRLRAGHTTNAREIAKFNRGKKVAILQRYESGKEKHYWFKVNLDGREGWMYGEFLKIDEGAREGTVSAAYR
jgi:hypothetical protein